MYICENSNYALLRGTAAAAPELSHQTGQERFFRFPIRVRRLSGADDVLNVIARERLIQKAAPAPGSRLQAEGEIRTFNNKSGVGPRLVITLFARSLSPADDPEDENRVALTGTLCKPPLLRLTPLGRSVCDLMLAVNRRYGRSDYLPCICWGSSAREAADWSTGTVVTLRGRFQSRDYIKRLPDGSDLKKTAYEISAMEAERLEDAKTTR